MENKQPENYRTIKRLQPIPFYKELSEKEQTIKKGLILDVETTGVDKDQDQIIELGLVLFEYGEQTGEVGAVGNAWSCYEQPSNTINEEITKLTGITDEMVHGHKIPDDEVEQIFSQAQIVIAHNAGFDRGFIEKRFPQLSHKAWACSFAELSWADYGFRCSKLECLLPAKTNRFVDAHRASDDCLALLHVLATPFENGEIPMKMLLESARKTTYRVWALYSSFDQKDLLKARGYRWNPGGNGQPKSWYIDLFESEFDAEREWLQENIYGGYRNQSEVSKYTAMTRYKQ